HLEAVMVAQATNAPLGQLRGVAVLEVLHRDGFPAWHYLAEIAGPEVADPQLVLQKGRHGVPNTIRVRGGVGIGAEERQDMALCRLDDATRPQALARQTQLPGQLAFANQNPGPVLAR